ncbi:MAG: stage III sporulation protein AA [Clostridia bacterium]|nr:stage III sporulation protein AA [Clostridia bacterium]
MTEKMDSFQSAAEILCDELQEMVGKIPDSKKHLIQEIRLRSQKPLAFSYGSDTLFTDSSGKILYSAGERAAIVTQRHIYDTFRRVCSYSVYSHQNEIKNGYITVQGGHRVGICGTASLSDGKIATVTDISSLNIRIARQVLGAAEEVIQKICPLEGGILLAGMPSSGKTTLLRDMAYRLSMGIGCKIYKTAVIDERGELSGTYKGAAYCDMGLCDVLNGYPKGEGMMQAVRSLSPQVIICDELGTDEDCQSVTMSLNSGAYVIATLHAADFDSLMKRRQTAGLLATGAFKTIIMLDSPDRPCKIRSYERI